MGSPRSATATARGDTQLLAIEHDQFLERLDSGDPIVRTLVLSLLRRTRAILAALPAEVQLPPEDLATESHEERAGLDKIRLEARLRDALDNRTLEVRYQPIHDIAEGAVRGYEALVRWQLPDRGAVSPAEFIKLAEETSLIVPVGEYVLDRVIEVLVALRDAGVSPLPSIAVNLSRGSWSSRAWRGRSSRAPNARSCRPVRSSSRSPKAACSTTRRSRRSCSTAARTAFRSRSTISARAIPTSRTCTSWTSSS
jgi:hypothetical protein